MSEPTDYDAVVVPDEKPREEYSYVERRAELLERIERRGHPDAFNKTELGKEYGVTHTSIGRDFDALAEYIGENLSNNHTFVMDRVLRGAILNLVEDDEYYKAVRAAEKWYEFLADMGEVGRAPERREVDVDASVTHEQTETEEYTVIPDDAEVSVEP